MRSEPLNILEIRKLRGLSVAQVSRQTGIPRSTITGWESHRHIPRDVTYFSKLLRFYGIRLSTEALQKLSYAFDCDTPAIKFKFRVEVKDDG